MLLTKPAGSPNRPIIGIFEGINALAKLKSQKPSFYQKVLAGASAKLGCITYHFSLYDLAGTNCIKGWYYNHVKRKWLCKPFPWPQVLYDRATFSKTAQRQAAKKFRKKLKIFGKTSFLNTRSVFGKGLTNSILEKMPLLKGYLPFSVTNPSSQTVQQLLNRYGTVFVKTEYGSNRNGVIKIVRQNRGYSLSTKYLYRENANFKRLWMNIRSIVGSRTIVAQRGINPPIYHARPLNVRSIVQRNGSGTWEVALVKPWVATTASLFGSPLPWAKTMAIYPFHTKVSDIWAKICNISLIVAKTLEARTGPLGELGIDFVVDTSGHPWIIEVNGKTNKSFFLYGANPETHYRLYYNPLAYSCFLAKNHNPRSQIRGDGVREKGC